MTNPLPTHERWYWNDLFFQLSCKSKLRQKWFKKVFGNFVWKREKCALNFVILYKRSCFFKTYTYSVIILHKRHICISYYRSSVITLNIAHSLYVQKRSSSDLLVMFLLFSKVCLRFCVYGRVYYEDIWQYQTRAGCVLNFIR